jgi:hypothetical protein
MGIQHYVWLYFWIAPHALLLAVAVTMYRRQQHRDFPIFFSYLLLEFLQFSVLLTMYLLDAPGTAYVKVDSVGRAASIALHFAILQELFESPVAHSVPLRREVARILNVIMVALMLLSVGFVGVLNHGSLDHWLIRAHFILNPLNTVQCALIVLVFLWHRFLGLRMLPLAFGIAVGIGLTTGLEPLFLALKTVAPTGKYWAIDIGQMATYHVVAALWLYHAQVREKVMLSSEAGLVGLREQAAELGRIAHL